MSVRERVPPGPRRSLIERVKSAVLSALIDVLIALVLVVLVWGVIGVARDVWLSITSMSVDAFKRLSIEILTVFVFIELFQSLSEYLRYQRLRVTTLVDASLAFVLREVWVGMYGGGMAWQSLLALAALVLALGIVRTLAVVYSPTIKTEPQMEG